MRKSHRRRLLLSRLLWLVVEKVLLRTQDIGKSDILEATFPIPDDLQSNSLLSHSHCLTQRETMKTPSS